MAGHICIVSVAMYGLGQGQKRETIAKKFYTTWPHHYRLFWKVLDSYEFHFSSQQHEPILKNEC